MRGQILSLTVGNRRVLTLLASLLIGTALLFSLGIRTAQTQTTPVPTTTYKVKELGDRTYAAYDLNDSGQVVGWGSSGGFLYENGQMIDLGAFDGPAHSEAHGINGSGQVVGFAYNVARTYSHAFLYEDGQMRDLGTLDGFDRSIAYDINASGQVVGNLYSQAADGSVTTSQAFLYKDGQMQDLGGNNSGAAAINDSGQVVGGSPDSGSFGFLYEDGHMTHLGTLYEGGSSFPNDINSSGQVVGASDSGIYNEETGTYEWHAFLYEDGQIQDLGLLEGHDYGEALGINDSGQVVGTSSLQFGSNERAFLYENGKMTDLNTLIPPGSGWTLHFAYAINSHGQIAAVGSKDGEPGIWRALLLTTTDDTTGPTVSLTAPTSGATVRGTSTLSASAFDDFGVTKVEFLVDGQVAATDTTAPYSTNWNSTTVSDGSKTIQAKAYDASNNETVSSSVTVTVDNTAPPDTTPPTVDEASLKPSKLQTGVQRNTNITATFSEELDPNTLTTSTFVLQQKVKKRIKGRRVWRWVSVSREVSCDTSTYCQTVTIDPYPLSGSSLLGANRSHRVIITTGIKDKAGNPLAQNYSWTFTTGSA